MTTERTLRITDEMAVRLAKILFDSDKVFWVSRARDALKAVLEPHLERRNGERRAGVNGSAPHSAQEGCAHEYDEVAYTGPWSKAMCHLCGKTEQFRLMSRPAQRASKKEQNKAPEISRAMTQEGLWAFYRDISGEDWKSNARHEEMADAYRAMEAQRRKEQGWDGLGPGGA